MSGGSRGLISINTISLDSGYVIRYGHLNADGTELIFREPSRADARAYMSFINSLADETMSGLSVNRKVTLKEEERWLEGVLSDCRARRTVMLMAERDGIILGNCEVAKMPFKHSHRANIGVALRKELRGKGVGEALMRRTMELARRRIKGLEAIELATFGYNDRAISLYNKLGFEEVARVPKAVKEGNAYFDEVIMRLELPPRGRATRERR